MSRYGAEISSPCWSHAWEVESMFRKTVCTLFMLVVFAGIALGEQIRGVITKVDGDKVTFSPAKFNKETKML